MLSKYNRMNRWVAMTDGTEVLYIGADNYPFPIPLAKDSDSRWYFDTGAGEAGDSCPPHRPKRTPRD